MTRRLLISERFDRALALMAAHYGTLRRHHLDAGSTLDDFIEALANRIGPLLVAQPGIGRRYVPAEFVLPDLIEEFGRLEVAGGSTVEFRRWPHGPFELLYAVTRNAIILVSARDQRQQDFH